MPYRDYLPSIAPPWMGQQVGTKFWQSIGDRMDGVREALNEATKARFPSTAPADALIRIGEDSEIPQGWSESDDDYRVYLRERWEAWGGDNTPITGKGGGAGSHLGILKALSRLRLPIGEDGITLVSQVGVWSQLDDDGNLVRGFLGQCVNRVDLLGSVNPRPGWTFDPRDNFFSLFGLVIPQQWDFLFLDSDLHHQINAVANLWKQGCAQFIGTWVIASGLTLGWPTEHSGAPRTLGTDPPLGANDVRYYPPDGGNRIGYYPPP